MLSAPGFFSNNRLIFGRKGLVGFLCVNYTRRCNPTPSLRFGYSSGTKIICPLSIDTLYPKKRYTSQSVTTFLDMYSPTRNRKAIPDDARYG